MNHFSNTFVGDKWTPFQNNPSDNQPTDISRLLEGERQNGLVDIAVLQDPDAMFKMHERVTIRNKATGYYDALNGTLEWNLLAKAFFSAENMQIIQDGLRYGVFKMSGEKINVPNQNVDNLKIIMRSIYLQNAEHYPKNIAEQVAKLNKLVLDYAVPNVYGEAVSYLKYLQDQSMLVVPMQRPAQTDRVFKQLQPRPFVDVDPRHFMPSL